MQRATGVTSAPYVKLTTAYYVRGFQIDSFEIDGVPALLGNMASSPQDMAVYERVEILRGSNGLLHGMGNPAATVNMVRKHAPKERYGETQLNSGGVGTVIAVKRMLVDYSMNQAVCVGDL
ncbi:Fe(III)-pyochelin receptor [Providencia stuartii]|nr:Fe(III)-pyochelin receptor [Providencia stuartii]